MKIRGYRRFICYLLVAILFGSGMCVEIKDVDPYFACESSQQPETQKYSNKINVISSDYCTNELLQRNNSSQYIKKDRGREEHRNLRNKVISISLWNVQPKMSYFEGSIFLDTDERTFSQEIIIKYIHQQDGKK